MSKNNKKLHDVTSSLEDRDSVLFIQRRYHTNQHPIVTTLQERGHTVRFLSLLRGPSENHSSISPDFVTYSSLFLFINIHIGHMLGGNFFHQFGVPKLYWYYSYLTDVSPDLIIIKKYFMISFVTVLFAKILGFDVLFYDQEPVYADSTSYKKRRLMSIFYYIIHQERFVRYSPVLGNPDEEVALPRSYYVPFVAPQSPRLLTRDYFMDNQVNILMIGKLHQERKGHLLLLRAINSLYEEFDLSVTIIGSLPSNNSDHYQSVKSYISQQELEDVVTIRVDLDYDTVQQEYNSHDIYVLPSWGEPAAVSHLEAMRHGLAVICTETNGTSCYIEEEQNGYLLTSRSQSDLEAKLRKLLTSRERIQTFGRHSRYLTETKYSSDKFYTRLASIVSDNYT